MKIFLPNRPEKSLKKVKRVKKEILDKLCLDFVLCYYKTIGGGYCTTLEYFPITYINAQKVAERIMDFPPKQQKESLSMLKKIQYRYSKKKIDTTAFSLYSDIIKMPVDRVVDTYNIMKKKRLIEAGIDFSNICYLKKSNNYKFKKIQNVDSSIFEILSN